MGLRDELLAEVGPKTHIADLCGRASDELLIKQMKIDQQKREIEKLRGYAIEITKTLTGLTVGGSEFFLGQKRLGFYEADLAACVKNVNWRLEQRLKLGEARGKAMPNKEA